MPNLISKIDVAQMLNVSRPTLDRLWTGNPSFPQPLRIGKALRWEFSEIVDWLKDQRKAAMNAATDRAAKRAFKEVAGKAAKETSRLHNLKEAHRNEALMPKSDDELDALVAKIDINISAVHDPETGGAA